MLRLISVLLWYCWTASLAVILPNSSIRESFDARTMCVSARNTTLPVTDVSGSFYNIGLTIGTEMKSQLVSFYSQYADLNNVYIPFYKSTEGLRFYTGLLNSATTCCGNEMKQLQGMADATGIDFFKIFLMNINEEAYLYLQQQNHTLLRRMRSRTRSASARFGTVGGQHNQDCSTILINREKADFLIAHDEDNDGEFSPYSYMINAQNVQLSNGQVGSFVAFAYPGMLAGNAFGFNGHGFVSTTNAVSQKGLPMTSGIPRYFLGHLILLYSATVNDVYALVSNNDVATGFSVNIADRAGNLANIELAAQASGNNTVNIAYVGNASDGDNAIDRLYHFNMYERLITIPQIAADIISSQHRATRASAMSPANTMDDAMTILGDTADLDYPIFRTPLSDANADQGCTLATAAFDLRNRKLSVYRVNPRNASSDGHALHFFLP